MSSRMVFKWTFAVCALFSAAVAAQEASQIVQGPEIEEFLARANISGMKDIPEGVTLPKKASLELNGVKHFSVWKTIDQGPVMQKQLDRGMELQFQDSWRTEVAAYELDKLLGLGMVPATVERSFNGKRGSLQFWVTSKMSEAERYKKKLHPP